MSKEQNNVKVIISNVGIPVPIENRPLWRLLITCYCIKLLSSDGIGLPIAKIRVASWMVLRPMKWGEYKDFLYGYNNNPPSIMPDRNVDKTIELGVAKGYFSISGSGRVELLEGSTNLMDMADSIQILLDEKEFLADIKQKLTDKMVKAMIGG